MYLVQHRQRLVPVRTLFFNLLAARLENFFQQLVARGLFTRKLVHQPLHGLEQNECEGRARVSAVLAVAIRLLGSET